MNFLAPFKFYRSEPRSFTIRATFHPDGEAVVANCELLGSRTLPNQAEPQVTVHFTGRVRLLRQLQVAPPAQPPGEPVDPVIESTYIYHLYFHGPAYQVLERAWRDGNRTIGKLAANLPANHVPAEKPTVIEPRLIELCFQTAGLWEMGALGTLGLPQRIQQVSILRPRAASQACLYAVITNHADDAVFDGAIVDSAGNQYVQLSGYRTIALPNSVDAEPLKALHAVAV